MQYPAFFQHGPVTCFGCWRVLPGENGALDQTFYLFKIAA